MKEKLTKRALNSLDKLYGKRRKLKIMIFAEDDTYMSGEEFILKAHYTRPVSKKAVKERIINILENAEEDFELSVLEVPNAVVFDGLDLIENVED